MGIYLNCHAAIESMRDAAEARMSANEKDARGPIVMIVGPSDVGKSTLSRILLNYGVRMGRRPIFVDLDVGQGHVGVPGSLGALLVERPADVVSGFSQQAPLVFHYGHKSPSINIALCKLLVTGLADVCRERLQANKRANISGIIINTCGWVCSVLYLFTDFILGILYGKICIYRIRSII